MDNDHKQLIDIFNNLIDIAEKNLPGSGFAEQLSHMTDYSLRHMTKDEWYLRSIDFPDIAEHKKQHLDYIKTTALFNSRFLTDNPPTITEVIDFLRIWWTNHIMNIDIQYEIHNREKILDRVRSQLQELSSERNRISGERFFKERVNIYGVKTAEVTKVAKERYTDLSLYSKKVIFEMCESLFKTQYLEESFIACDWVYRNRSSFEKSDFDVFERWIDSYIKNWATCDTFCNHSVGAFIEEFPEYIKDLKRWALSNNLWVRRAAAVSLIIPARKGLFLTDILEISSTLLLDKDDMVQKGYGWLLKVTSDKHLQEIFEFVMNNKDSMPRTSLRYAIEKMPNDYKKQAMAK